MEPQFTYIAGRHVIAMISPNNIGTIRLCCYFVFNEYLINVLSLVFLNQFKIYLCAPPLSFQELIWCINKCWYLLSIMILFPLCVCWCQWLTAGICVIIHFIRCNWVFMLGYLFSPRFQWTIVSHHSSQRGQSMLTSQASFR